MANRRYDIEKRYKVNFDSFQPAMKVQLVLRLEEKRAEIEGRRYEGLSKREITGAMGRFKSGLTPRQIGSAIKLCYMWGMVIPETRERKDGEYEAIYRTAACEYHLLDPLLKRLGWLRERVTV